MSATSAQIATLTLGTEDSTKRRLRVLEDVPPGCEPADCLEHPDNRGPILAAVERLNKTTAAIVQGDQWPKTFLPAH